MIDARTSVSVDKLVDGAMVVWRDARATVISVSQHAGRWRSAAEPPPAPTGATRWREESRREAETAGWKSGYYRKGQDFTFVDVELATDDGIVKLSLPSWWRCFTISAHHPVCASCGGLWPCLEQRRDMEGERLVRELAEQCSGCGEHLGHAGFVRFTTPEGIRRQYHAAASKRKCRRLANEEADAAGLVIIWQGWDSKVVPIGAAADPQATGHVAGCTGDPLTVGCPGCVSHAAGRGR